MSNIIWSLTDGGSAITTALDHGGSSNGSETAIREIYVRHTFTNPITSAKLFIRELSTTYTGSATAPADISEVIAWGNEDTANGFGGYFVNMNAAGTYPAASWPTYLSKAPTSGFVCKTGVGDSELNAVLLDTNSGCTSAGVIIAGTTPNVRFSVKIQVPDDEDTVGERQFETALVFTYTS